MVASHSGVLALPPVALPAPVYLTARAMPFDERVQKTLSYGGSIADILRHLAIEESFWPYLHIALDGETVEGELSNCRPGPGSVVVVSALVQKGGLFRAIARIAISAAVAYFAPVAAGALFPSLTTGSFGLSLATAAIGFGLNSVAGLALNAIAPPAAPRFNASQGRAIGAGGNVSADVKDSSSWFIEGARNQLRPNEPVGEVLGTHRYVPPLAARGTIETEGNAQFARQIFDWGYGPVTLSDIKIGETLLSSFTDVTQSHDLDGSGVPSVDLFTLSYDIDDLSIGLDTSYQTRTTQKNVDEIIVDITCPSGLVRFDDRNNKLSQSVILNIDYAVAGSGVWITSSQSIDASSTAAVRKSFRFIVTAGNFAYDVRVRRASSESADVKVRDEAFWTALKTVTYETPILEGGLAVTALRIKATEQLNGQIDQLNALVSKQVPDWDTATQSWITRASSNPASLVRYVWQSPYNELALNDEDIDLVALQEWHEYCALKGYTFNAVIDYETTVDQLVRDICASGRASPENIDGRWSIIVDKAQSFVANHFTPRNSRDYQLEIIFPDEVHAFRVQIINAAKGYQQDVITVYDDGYSSTNASKFERLELFGVTDTQAAYKLAREHIASIRLRPEIHSFLTDAESLPLVRGDRIYFSHDVPLVGLCAGRIKTVSDNGANVTGITVDEPCPMEAGKNYYLRIRTADGASLYKQVVTVAGDQSCLTFSMPFALADAPAPGDLYTFGEEGRETLDLMVQRIEYQADFAARVFAVNYDEAIYEASEGTIPDFDPGVTEPPSFRRPLAPEIIAVQSDEEVQLVNLDGSISSRMVIRLNNRNSVPVDPIVKIRLVGSGEFTDAAVVSRTDSQVIIEGLDEGSYYDIRLYYKRIGEVTLGNNLLSEAAALNGQLFIGSSAAPPDVENFDITVRSDSVFLSWNKVSVVDLDGYEIRFSPVTSGAAWESALRVGPLRGKGDLSAIVPHRIGTYLIKAIDRAGNFSENAAAVLTTIGQLDGLNAVETIVEAPSWAGTYNGTSEDSGVLQLGSVILWDSLGTWDDLGMWDYADGEIASGGTYEFEGSDLGAVYTCVVSASLSVSGTNINDFMDNVGLWDERETWDGSDPSQYDVRLRISTTNDDPSGNPTYSDWRDIQAIGEYTFRHPKFQLVLTSRELNVTPLVSECTVIIDAPDRFESGKNIASGTGGHTVTFDNSFASGSTPAVQITANNMSTGDYYTISGTDEDGFTIEFFNALGVSLNRTFDYLARGYGRKS